MCAGCQEELAEAIRQQDEEGLFYASRERTKPDVSRMCFCNKVICKYELNLPHFFVLMVNEKGEVKVD
jgi:hypothetical protein